MLQPALRDGVVARLVEVYAPGVTADQIGCVDAPTPLWIERGEVVCLYRDDDVVRLGGWPIACLDEDERLADWVRENWPKFT